jgi:hypothetical protein
MNDGKSRVRRKVPISDEKSDEFLALSADSVGLALFGSAIHIPAEFAQCGEAQPQNLTRPLDKNSPSLKNRISCCGVSEAGE